MGYTYMFVRMQRNPLAYGVAWDEVAADPRLDARRRALITDAARELERSKMARFDERSGNLYITELVRLPRQHIFYFDRCSQNIVIEDNVTVIISIMGTGIKDIRYYDCCC